mmetsp:Transcript_21364/g.49038  ORF Transcript_21364/g.49038 Transcript_21364/m.49038 type:complete len:201 (+) Transcript_21364:1913-2515(+)
MALSTSTSPCLICIVPSFSAAESRMSLISRFRRCALCSMVWSVSFESRSMSSAQSSMRYSDRPMMPLRGVRSSWETAAMNCSCWRAAASSWASASFIFSSSVMLFSITMIAGAPVPGSTVGMKDMSCTRTSSFWSQDWLPSVSKASSCAFLSFHRGTFFVSTLTASSPSRSFLILSRSIFPSASSFHSQDSMTFSSDIFS